MLEGLAALAKLALYAGSLSAAGTALAWASLARVAGNPDAVRGLIAAGAAATVAAAAAGALILTLRLGGDFSGAVLSAVFAGPVGIAAGLQVAGAGALFVFSRARGFGAIPFGIAAIALLASYGVIGHAAGEGLAYGSVAFIHVSAAAWWLGALVVLLRAGGRMTGEAFARLVQKFSRIAVRIVIVLVLAGSLLAFVIADASTEQWLTPYVKNLSVKILLAASALAIATGNKLRLAPRLAREEAAVARLRRSIVVEIALITAVLAATAWLTTFNPPHS